MEPEVNKDLANLMVSLLGRTASRVLAWVAAIFFVAWGVISIIKQAREFSGILTNTGPFPSLVDMAITLGYVLAMLAGAVFVTALMWGLADNITGRLYYRREIREIRAEITAIKKHLGIED